MPHATFCALRSCQKAGGNNAGGARARLQPCWSFLIKKRQAFKSLDALLTSSIVLSKSEPHSKIIAFMRHSTFGAQGLPAHHLKAIIIATQTAGFPRQAEEASIALSAMTGKHLQSQHGAAAASQHCAVIDVACSDHSHSQQEVENGRCVKISKSTGRRDMAMARQSFVSVIATEGKLVARSDERPSGELLPSRKLDLFDFPPHQTKDLWWDKKELAYLTQSDVADAACNLGPHKSSKKSQPSTAPKAQPKRATTKKAHNYQDFKITKDSF